MGSGGGCYRAGGVGVRDLERVGQPFAAGFQFCTAFPVDLGTLRKCCVHETDFLFYQTTDYRTVRL
jgi:hypothetical protein